MSRISIVVVETFYFDDGKPGSRIIGRLPDPELCKIVLERLITRRETEVYRLKKLTKNN